MAGSVIDLLYPQRCPVCGNIQAFGSSGICKECETNLPWINEPVCLKCGKMIEDAENEFCEDCTKIPKSFERCYPAFSYDGKIKDSIYEFKYKNQREHAAFYADCIVRRYGAKLKRLSFDGIVPVPVHSIKRKKRGYNQAQLLANELGKRLNVVVYPNYLIRKNNTNPQKELNDAQRIKNLKNAFNIGENVVKLDVVLLVDDIYTSGATMEACTQALKAYGVGEVYCVSIAIGRGYS